MSLIVDLIINPNRIVREQFRPEMVIDKKFREDQIKWVAEIPKSRNNYRLGYREEGNNIIIVAIFRHARNNKYKTVYSFE